ncbi:MAG TPA: hypothetical protein VN495_01700 [Candidatus Paceibacterota bacterium]|nr:hypothetical protein [Candidatus Paceibacterota bacterium]
MIFKLIASGKYIAIGGLSLVGSAAHEVRIVMFFQINDGDVQGWKLSIGHPDDPEPDFRYIETREVELAKWPFPNAAVYFVGEVDPRLVSETAPPVLLSEAARFIIPFINEDGPPEGIDW